jgi:hypothetical protein
MEHRPGFSYTELRNMAIYRRKLIIYKIINKMQRENERKDPSKQDMNREVFRRKINTMNRGK